MGVLTMRARVFLLRFPFSIHNLHFKHSNPQYHFYSTIRQMNEKNYNVRLAYLPREASDMFGKFNRLVEDLVFSEEVITNNINLT